MTTLKRIGATLAALAVLGSGLPEAVRAQWDVTPKAALPAWELWWPTAPDAEIATIPLLWTNDVDGGGEGCCVVGAGARYRTGPGTLWLGVGFGTSAEAGAPAALEVAAEIEGAALAFRHLHGRNAVSAFLPLTPRQGRRSGDGRFRMSAGASGNWMYDDRYAETFVAFNCPADAPAAPCQQVETAFAWSEGRDYSVVAEATLGLASRRGRLSAGVIGGLKVLDGDHDYLRAEVEVERTRRWRSAALRLRLAGGWASGDAPLQRRFHLGGADPVTRWLNPYLDAQGALLSGGHYYAPGGPGLRAYTESRPLVKRYLAARGEIGRSRALENGLRGGISLFLEGAWTPGLPDRIGPEEFDLSGPILFDWRDLPAGEGRERGQFMARVLSLSEIWADAGFALTGGYKVVSVTVALPIWASEPALADEPVGGGERKAFAARWSFTVAFSLTADEMER